MLVPFPSHRQKMFVPGIQLRLELRGVALSASLEDSLGILRDLFLVIVEIADRRIDLAGTQVKKASNLRCRPSLLEIGCGFTTTQP